jgi:hypothetical protein
MKNLLALALALTALGCLSTTVEAKTYSVKNIGKQGLANSCARGGGSFTDGENSYSCTYKNGNIRECSKRDGHCIVETPPKRIVPDFGVAGPFDEEFHHDSHTAPTGGDGGPLQDHTNLGTFASAMAGDGGASGVIY